MTFFDFPRKLVLCNFGLCHSTGLCKVGIRASALSKQTNKRPQRLSGHAVHYAERFKKTTGGAAGSIVDVMTACVERKGVPQQQTCSFAPFFCGQAGSGTQGGARTRSWIVLTTNTPGFGLKMKMKWTGMVAMVLTEKGKVAVGVTGNATNGGGQYLKIGNTV